MRYAYACGVKELNGRLLHVVTCRKRNWFSFRSFRSVLCTTALMQTVGKTVCDMAMEKWREDKNRSVGNDISATFTWRYCDRNYSMKRAAGAG